MLDFPLKTNVARVELADLTDNPAVRILTTREWNPDYTHSVMREVADECDNRVEFEAFPQVEYLELPCAAIKGVSLARANKNLITIVFADTTYRFELRARSQSRQFVATLISNCKISSKGIMSGRKMTSPGRCFGLPRSRQNPYSHVCGSRGKLVGLEQVLRKRDRHRRVYVGGKRIPTQRATLQIPVGDQARFALGFPMFKVADPLFPHIAGVVNGVLSFFVRVVQLVERLLVFHGLSLRRSYRHPGPKNAKFSVRTTGMRVSIAAIASA